MCLARLRARPTPLSAILGCVLLYFCRFIFFFFFEKKNKIKKIPLSSSAGSTRLCRRWSRSVHRPSAFVFAFCFCNFICSSSSSSSSSGGTAFTFPSCWYFCCVVCVCGQLFCFCFIFVLFLACVVKRHPCPQKGQVVFEGGNSSGMFGKLKEFNAAQGAKSLSDEAMLLIFGALPKLAARCVCDGKCKPV